MWKKIVSVILFAVLCLSLFSGWVGLGGAARAIIVENFGNEDLFIEEFEGLFYELIDEIESNSDMFYMFGDAVKMAKSAGVIFACLVDLRLAPSEFGPLCNNISSLLEPILSLEFSEEAEVALVAVKALGIVSNAFLYIMLALLVLIFILTFTSKKNVCGLHIVVMIMSLLQFAVIGLAVLVLNGLVAEELGYRGAKLLSLTAWPYMALICSIAGLVFYCLSCKKTVAAYTEAKIPAVSAESWTCEVCGAECTNGGSFCPNCGSQRPQKKLCPGCGKEQKEGARFCPYCGTSCE